MFQARKNLLPYSTNSNQSLIKMILTAGLLPQSVTALHRLGAWLRARLVFVRILLITSLCAR